MWTRDFGQPDIGADLDLLLRLDVVRELAEGDLFRRREDRLAAVCILTGRSTNNANRNAYNTVILCIPPLEEEPWPTLGAGVCNFIERYLVYGPGDLLGEPARLSDEQRALIFRMYEVYPRTHPLAGRRRFRRAGISLQKGSQKTELAAWITAVELHPDGPVRTVSWGVRGDPSRPVGGGIRDPYIPMVAYTEEQTEDLAYGALFAMLEKGPLASDFDIGLERIMRLRGDGKAVALASAPDARDGARTTFQHFDETHRFTLPRLKAAHRTMQANLTKRPKADPWGLETTTAPEPGAGSIAEDTMDYARVVEAGKIKDSKLFYFHRQASEELDFNKEKDARRGIIEAAGPSSAWKDFDAMMDLWRDPKYDRAYWERVFGNRLVRGATQAFDTARWKELADPHYIFGADELITLGFDGAPRWDSTALIATVVETGYQWPIAVWERPAHLRHEADWEVPYAEVDAVVTDCYENRNVWRGYFDPYWFEGWLAAWAGRWGQAVVSWETNRTRQMAEAVQNFAGAIMSDAISHDGSEVLTRHLGNARRRNVTIKDSEGRELWTIQKERSDSPHKIDAVMAAILSWQARTDAIAAGAAIAKAEWAAV